MKEKRKNFTNEDLKAISLQVSRDAQDTRQDKVNAYADKIMQRIGQGKFRVDSFGYLHIRMWGSFAGKHDDELKEALRKHFAEVYVPWGGLLSTDIKVKP